MKPSHKPGTVHWIAGGYSRRERCRATGGRSDLQTAVRTRPGPKLASTTCVHTGTDIASYFSNRVAAMVQVGRGGDC